MIRKLKKIVKSYNIIIFGILFGISFWFIEAILHTIFFETQFNFFEHILTTSLHELWMRSIACSFIVLFSIFVFLVQRRKSKLNMLVRDIFNGIQDGISILDSELNIVQVNHWMKKMYLPGRPIAGQKCYTIYQNRDNPCPWCPAIKTFESGQMNVEIVPYPSENDIQGWLFISAYPIKDKENNVINVIEHLKDITELKKIEKKYKDAFNRAEFYKDLFAHDINNILQNILTSSELCIHFSNLINSENKLEALLSTIQNQVKRASTLVSNVRKLSKIEETTLPIQKIDLNELLQEVVYSLKNSYPSNEFNLQISNHTNIQFIHANELISDVFENILNNAVKYNDNPIIEITVKISQILRNKKNYIKIEFIDNGMGIEDIRKDMIFERAYMEGESVSGMGLGLSLVKRIIDSYNGDIWVEDRIEEDYTKGSNFVILIPEEKEKKKNEVRMVLY